MNYFPLDTIYLLPDKINLSKKRKTLLAQSGGKVFIRPQVYTFSQFINVLLKQEVKKKQISNEQRRFWALSWVKEHWSFEGQTINLIDNISFVAQLADKMLEISGLYRASQLDNSLLNSFTLPLWAKLLNRFCLEYEDFLQKESLTDFVGAKLELLKNLQNGSCPPVLKLVKKIKVIDFYKISAYELEILQALSIFSFVEMHFKIAKWILSEELSESFLTGLDTLISLEKLEKSAADNNNFQLFFEPLASDKTPPDLAYLGENLFAPPSKVDLEKPTAISLQINSLWGIEEEVSLFASKVYYLLKNSVNPEKITLVIPDLPQYKNYLQKLDDLYFDLPQGALPLSASSPVRTVLSWLDLWGSFWPSLKVLDFFRSPFIAKALDFQSYYELFNHSFVLDERNKAGFFHWLPKIETKKAKIFLQELETLKNIYKNLDEASTWSDFFKYFNDFWESLKFKENIIKVEGQEKYTNIHSGQKLFLIFKELEEALNCAWAPKVERETFKFFLKEKITKTFLDFNLQKSGRIKVFNYETLIPHDCDYLFCLGLNEDTFPKQKTQYYPWPDQFTKDLRKLIGVWRWPAPAEFYRQQEERLTWAISEVKKQVFLSFSTLNDDFTFTLPSPLINSLENLFADNLFVTKRGFDNKNSTEISSKQDLLDSVLINNYQIPDYFPKDKQVSLKLAQRKIILAENRKDNLRNYQLGFNVDIIDNSFLKIDTVNLWLENRPKWNKTILLSPSNLELYAKCPFQFFVFKVLALKEEKEGGNEVSPLNLGTLFHRVLKDFVLEQVENKLWPLSGSKEEEACLYKHLDGHLKIFETENFLGRHSIWEMRKKYIRNRFHGWFYRETNNPSAKEYTPKLFEWSFNNKEEFISENKEKQKKFDFEPKNNKVPEGLPLLLIDGDLGLSTFGRIDRIDFSAKEALVWDYKSNYSTIWKSRINENKICEDSFQLALYCLAVEQNFEKTCKGGYQFLSGPLDIKSIFTPTTSDKIFLKEPDKTAISKFNFYETLQKLWLSLKNGCFFPKEDIYNCEYCACYNLCPLKEA